jgi:nucleotide-binding universal stress UspA family protein
MYRTILVGYDGRDSSRDALALGQGLATVEGAKLVLLAALELDPLATPADAYERAMAEAEERLGAAAREQLGETAFRLRTVGGVGAPRGRHEVAADEAAHGIVRGSTHRHGLGRVLPGSVGERLLQGAPCAVLVAPSGFAGRERLEIARIGVGYDGKTESGHARGVAAGLAEELGATVETITVSGDGESEPADPGDAATELVERSRELDLLVVGSRGYGPVRHALLGSVTSKLMEAALCPVLVVPRSDQVV